MAELRCLECDKQIPPGSLYRYPHKKYCSHNCQKKSATKRYQKYNPHKNLPKGTVGALGELIVAVDLMKKGNEVFRALSPHTSCDLAILKDGKLKRIEVRTGYLTASGKLSYPKKANVRADMLAVIVGDRIEYIDIHS